MVKAIVNGKIVDADADWLADRDAASVSNVLDYENAIQNLVDETAKTKQFRDGGMLATYVASTNPQWAAEAQAFVAWRDGVWGYAYAELAKVQAGQREQPTIEAFLAEVEPIEWPALQPV